MKWLSYGVEMEEIETDWEYVKRILKQLEEERKREIEFLKSLRIDVEG